MFLFLTHFRSTCSRFCTLPRKSRRFIAREQKLVYSTVGVSFIGTGNRGTRRKPVTNHWQTLSHNVVSNIYTLPWKGFKFTTLVVIWTACTGSCTSNYHMITIMTTATPSSGFVYYTNKRTPRKSTEYIEYGSLHCFCS